MAKLSWFLQPSVSPEDFDDRWLAAIEGWTPPQDVSRWVRSAVARDGVPLFFNSPYLALEELWCEDDAVDSVRAAILDRENGLAARLTEIVDLDGSPLVATEERVVIDGSEHTEPGGIRQVAFAIRKKGITREEFFDHWHDIHAPLVKRSPAISRYVQGRVLDGDDAPCDGLAQIYFENLEAVTVFAQSEEYLGEQVRDDAPTFVQVDEVIAINIDRQWEIAVVAEATA